MSQINAFPQERAYQERHLTPHARARKFTSVQTPHARVEDSLTDDVICKAEIFISIFGACVVTLGPVYRQLRYGDPQGSSSKAKKLQDVEKIWEKENGRIGRSTIGIRGSVGPLGAHEEGRTTITGSWHHILTPTKGNIVDDGLDWSQNSGEAC